MRSDATVGDRRSRDDADMTDPEPLGPGAMVEVRTRFDGHWARGFEVVTANDRGYRVRRHSDGRELPTEFAPDDVRTPHERKRGTWWY